MRRLLVALVAVFLVAGTAPAQAHGGSYDMKYVDGSNLLLLTFNTHPPSPGWPSSTTCGSTTCSAPRSPTTRWPSRCTPATTTEHHPPHDHPAHEKTQPMLATNESKLTYNYPLPGSYTLRVVFRAGGRAISSGEFAVDVGQGTPGAPGGFPWIRVALVLLLGVVIGTALPRGAGADPTTQGPVPTEPPIPSRRCCRSSCPTGSATRSG